MAVKFYKKLDPKNQPVLSDHTRLDFKTLDHLQGYYATNSEKIQQEVEQLMREGRYGMTEISEAEFYRDYVEKKTQLGGALRPLWREEQSGTKVTGNSPFQTLGAEAVAAAVAIKPPEPTPVAIANPADGGSVVTNPPAKQQFKPPVGRRVPKVIPSRPTV